MSQGRQAVRMLNFPDGHRLIHPRSAASARTSWWACAVCPTALDGEMGVDADQLRLQALHDEGASPEPTGYPLVLHLPGLVAGGGGPVARPPTRFGYGQPCFTLAGAVFQLLGMNVMT